MKFVDLLLDQIGDWNPQLLREIKGRLRVRNLLGTLAISLLGQLLFCLYWIRQLPGKDYKITSYYCRLRETYLPYSKQVLELQQQVDKLQASQTTEITALQGQIAELTAKLSLTCPENQLDYQLWWQDHFLPMFAILSIISLGLLLMIGTYLIMSDLGREKQRGTLNFIQLSPQFNRSIFLGKILGVPILLYLGVVSTVPLNIYLGIRTEMSWLEILIFYLIIISSCAFYFSTALFYTLLSKRFYEFQAWLGSSLIFTTLWLKNNRFQDSPSILFPYGETHPWYWFVLPINSPKILINLLIILIYAFGTYWIWQGLICTPYSTIKTSDPKSKVDSLLVGFNVFCFDFVLQNFDSSKIFHNTCSIGLSLQGFIFEHQLFYEILSNLCLILNLCLLAVLNFFLILGTSLFPSAQSNKFSKWECYPEKIRKESFNQDILWRKKGLYFIAITLNVLILLSLLNLLRINFMIAEVYNANMFDIITNNNYNHYNLSIFTYHVNLFLLTGISLLMISKTIIRLRFTRKEL